MKDMKQECLTALALAGIDDQNLAPWYEAIYANPDMSHVKQTITDIVTKITISDVLALSQEYLISGALAGATKTVDYFCRLYHIEQDIQVMRGDPLARFAPERCDVCCYYLSEIRGQNLVQSEVLIGNQLRNRPIATYVRAISHEIWHAYQIMHKLKWLRMNNKKLNVAPGLVPLGARYTLNLRHVIYSDEDETGYVQQLIEQEAYLACDYIMNHIEHLFREAYLRGENVQQQEAVFYSLPIFRS